MSYFDNIFVLYLLTAQCNMQGILILVFSYLKYTLEALFYLFVLLIPH